MASPIIEAESIRERTVVDATAKEPIRVLHVDDDYAFQKIAKQCLESEGTFQVYTASSVAEAIQKMKEETFDVIVSDYVMPEKDGLDFLKELRVAGNTIPFVLFTGKGREEIAIKALNLGADGYFNKFGSPETVYGELAHNVRQIAKSKKAEEALSRNESYLRSILDSTLTGIIVIDEESQRIVDINPHALETIGASRQQVIGKACQNFICAAEKGSCPIIDLGQTVDRSESVLLNAAGERLPILKTVVKMRWKDGRYLVESFVDITGRKISERATRESQEKFERLFRSSPEAAVYLDSDYHILDANPRFSELFGFSIEEIKGKRASELIVPEDKKEEAQKFDLNSQEPFERQDAIRRRKNGELVTVSISAAPINVENQLVGYVGLYRDITQLKHYEKSLSALNNHGKDLNMAKSMDQIYELTLDAAEKTLGFEFADILIIEGRMLRLATQRGRPKDYSIEMSLEGDKGITVRTAKTGIPALVLDTRKEEDYVKFRNELQMGSELVVPIKTGQEILGVINVERKEFGAFNKKDQELLEILASHAATAISNLNRAENLARMNEKLRVVGGLTRHDARNKLTAITCSVYLAKSKSAGNEAVLNILKDVQSAVSQMTRIFEFAKTYEMIGVEELQYIDVERMMYEAISLFSDLKGVKVVNNCHGLTVLADSLLRQLFYNLVDNSLKYGEKIKTIKAYYELADADKLRLIYEDDGVGIAEAEKTKLFREGQGKGTGYGLYLIRKMCEAYGWNIQETGKYGIGAQFTITVPRIGEKRETNYSLTK